MVDLGGSLNLALSGIDFASLNLDIDSPDFESTLKEALGLTDANAIDINFIRQYNNYEDDADAYVITVEGVNNMDAIELSSLDKRLDKFIGQDVDITKMLSKQIERLDYIWGEFERISNMDTSNMTGAERASIDTFKNTVKEYMKDMFNPKKVADSANLDNSYQRLLDAIKNLPDVCFNKKNTREQLQEQVKKAAQDEVQTEVGGKQGAPPLSGASCNRPLPEGYLTRGEIKQILIDHDVIDPKTKDEAAIKKQDIDVNRVVDMLKQCEIIKDARGSNLDMMENNDNKKWTPGEETRAIQSFIGTLAGNSFENNGKTELVGQEKAEAVWKEINKELSFQNTVDVDQKLGGIEAIPLNPWEYNIK